MFPESEQKSCFPEGSCSCLLAVVSHRALQTNVRWETSPYALPKGCSQCSSCQPPRAGVLPTPWTSFFFGCRYNVPAPRDLYFCQVRGDQEQRGLWGCMGNGTGLLAGRRCWAGDPQLVLINLTKKSLDVSCRRSLWGNYFSSQRFPEQRGLFVKWQDYRNSSVVLVAFDQNNTTSCFLMSSSQLYSSVNNKNFSTAPA